VAFSAIGGRHRGGKHKLPAAHLKGEFSTGGKNVQIMSAKPAECNETQLEAIRELMLRASKRGEWLTLAEIAAPTEFGEASISAQLRHLRKPQHGAYCVEKRRRRSSAEGRLSSEARGTASFAVCDALWEYRIFVHDQTGRITKETHD
jgi:hypothetical protein